MSTTAVWIDPPTMTRGDLEPPVEIEIGDEQGIADFSDLAPADVRVVAVQGSLEVVNDAVTSVVPSADGKTARVLRTWASGETDDWGRMWITVVVDWPGGRPQHYPEDTPLLLNIRKAPGDD